MAGEQGVSVRGWIGWAMSVLVVVVMAIDGLVALFAPAMLQAPMAETGFPPERAAAVGIIALVSAIIYAVPRTAVLGAILITGFVGGALCAHLRVETAIVPSEIVCVLIGLATWGGLYLRDARVGILLPLSSSASSRA